MQKKNTYEGKYYANGKEIEGGQYGQFEREENKIRIEEKAIRDFFNSL